MTTILRERSLTNPEEIALTDLDVEFGWAQLAEACERGVRAIDALGLTPDRRIGIVARNSATTALAYMVARYAGVPLVPMSFHLTAAEIEYIVRDAGVDVLLFDASTAAAVLAASAAAGVEHCIGWETDHGCSWWEWIGAHDSGPVDLARPAVSNVLYTSGTTGFPKGVLHPRSISGSIDSYIEAYREPADSGPYLTVGPLYHAGPLGSIRRLTGGRPLIVLKKFEPEPVLQVIEDRAVTGVTMVPTHFIRLLDLPIEHRAGYDLSSLEMVDHTGSACPVDVKRQMIEWFGPILVERYGGTESGTICTIGSAEWLDHPGSVGRPSERYTVLVVDDDQRELPVGHDGQIYFVDALGQGIRYEGDPDKTARAHLRPGVFTLGDLGHVDADGYLYITGRTSDTVISGGVNLYPAEIERVLLEHPGIADAAVVGVPDPVMGERLTAVLVLRDPPISIEEITAHCTARLAGPKRPRAFEVVDALPRNPMGKLQRNVLRDQLGN